MSLLCAILYFLRYTNKLDYIALEIFVNSGTFPFYLKE
ncbi:hypothetical protein PU02_1318 [Bartonella ancashensis]|uniref:Uncharacterized protein n=1 Tax=Bartonella ancashensis TaxID=1318743 RepID=A0A0M4LHI4_9HYPH|nr:hypothetical protein PU02_1318 [Bartonella ancashensis]